MTGTSAVRNVGIVGAGLVGQLRARAVAGHPALRLRGVADVALEQARRAAHATGAAAFADYRDLLALPDLDIAIVCVPTPLHEETTIAALASGRDVLCEKPIASTVEAGRRMVEAARAAGRTLAVGFNHRYFPSVQFLKRTLEAGTIGTLDHVRAFGGHIGLSEFRADWMYQGAQSGGGAMMDIGLHLTDLIGFLCGEITEGYGVATNRIWRVEGSEDNAVAVFRTAAGVPVAYQATWAEWRGFRSSIDVYGTHGMVRATYAPMFNLVVRRQEGGRARRTWNLHVGTNVRDKVYGWQTTAQQTFFDELTDFVRRLDGQPSAGASGEDGLRAVEAAHAVYESSRSGQAVVLTSTRAPLPPRR